MACHLDIVVMFPNMRQLGLAFEGSDVNSIEETKVSLHLLLG